MKGTHNFLKTTLDSGQIKNYCPKCGKVILVNNVMEADRIDLNGCDDQSTETFIETYYETLFPTKEQDAQNRRSAPRELKD